MNDIAFHLNADFLNELWLRINRLMDTPTAAEIFGSFSHHSQAVPAKEHLATLIDSAFWMSLTQDEGNPVTASMILKPAEHSFDAFLFDTPIPLTVKHLVKLGAALENPRADIGVWPDDTGALQIWGFRTRGEDVMISELWIQTHGPGRVLITYAGKNLGAMSNNRALFIDHANLMRTIIPKLSTTSGATEDNLLRLVRYGSLLSTARAMRNHGRGGTLLVVPDSTEWKQSIQAPIPYTGGANFLQSEYDASQKPSLLAPLSDLFSTLIKKKEEAQRSKLIQMRRQVDQQCKHIARLTAVDGALVMTFDRYVFCFGAKIIPGEGYEPPVLLQRYTPVEGDRGSEISLSDTGGTRHQSAAQFAAAHPGAIAVVVSQDGDVSIISKNPSSGELDLIQQAELAILHEGPGAAIWNYTRFAEMGWI